MLKKAAVPVFVVLAIMVAGIGYRHINQPRKERRGGVIIFEAQVSKKDGVYTIRWPDYNHPGWVGPTQRAGETKVSLPADRIKVFPGKAPVTFLRMNPKKGPTMVFIEYFERKAARLEVYPPSGKTESA